MKNFIITLFIFIISLNAHICIALEEQKDTKMNPEYKVLHCNNAGIGCIVRNNVLKYGLSDNNGNILLQFEFSNISIAKDGSSNFILVKNTKTGIADANGKIVIPCDYLRITQFENTDKYTIQPSWDNNIGLADMKTGHINIEPVYQRIYRMTNGAYLVEKDDKQGIFNNDYKLIVPPEYSFIMLFPGNKYYRLHKEVTFTNAEGLPQNQDKYGIADTKGNLVVPVDCSWIDKNLSSYKQNVIKNGKNYVFDAKNGKLEQK